MIYFSEIKNKKVFTEDGVLLGRLDDLVFLASENPLITKLIIINNKKEKFIIPINFLLKINKKIIIKKNFLNSEIKENELFILRNILDKQIIDLIGNKIVRVNDVIIQDKPFLVLIGVDIGFLGILRWLKLEKIIVNIANLFNLKIKTNTLSWSDIQPLELIRGKVKLKKVEEKLKKLKPEDLADYLEKTSINNVEKILSMIDQNRVAEIINNLSLSYQSQIFKRLKLDKAVNLIELIDPDESVDILLTLSKKKREAIMKLISEDKKKEINYLINLSQKSSLGELITTEYLVVDSNLTVSEIINKIKKETADFYFLPYVYVSNINKQLIGVVSLHDLLLEDYDKPIYKFMTQNLIVAHLSTPKEIVLKKMIKYKLQALPIIDNQKHILGIVTFDDLIESCSDFISI